MTFWMWYLPFIAAVVLIMSLLEYRAAKIFGLTVVAVVAAFMLSDWYVRNEIIELAKLLVGR